MPEYCLFCVADGMGGHDGGDIASRLTLESIANYMDSINPKTDVNITSSITNKLFTSTALDGSIHFANSMVYQEAVGKMMGSTIVAGQFMNNEFRLVHAGDSRAYLLNCGCLHQLTQDHSLVNELYLQGQITKEDMRTHSQRNIITRAIGTSADIEISVQSPRVTKEDLLLLCSDGLTSMLEDEEIADILNSGQDLTFIGEKLIQRANDSGGRDNITVLLVSIL
jgi:protein phosphatase